jgi:hypothetical protein
MKQIILVVSLLFMLCGSVFASECDKLVGTTWKEEGSQPGASKIRFDKSGEAYLIAPENVPELSKKINWSCKKSILTLNEINEYETRWTVHIVNNRMSLRCVYSSQPILFTEGQIWVWDLLKSRVKE